MVALREIEGNLLDGIISEISHKRLQCVGAPDFLKSGCKILWRSETDDSACSLSIVRGCGVVECTMLHDFSFLELVIGYNEDAVLYIAVPTYYFVKQQLC